MPVKTDLTFRDVLFCAGNPRLKCLKVFDYLFGGLVCFIWRPGKHPPKKFDKGAISRILVIRPGGIGDAALVIPMIREIKSRLPGASIDLLCEKRNGGVFALAGNSLGNIFFYDNLSIFKLLGILRRNNYDLVFDTEQWHNLTAVVSCLVSFGIRVGFATRPLRARYYTLAVGYNQADHELDSFLNLLRALLPEEKVSYTYTDAIKIPPAHSAWARKILSADDKIAVICLSASIRERSWPVSNFQELANHLIDKGYKVLFLGGVSERKMLNAIMDRVLKKSDMLDFVGKANIAESAALLDLSALYIGLDSGMLQIARLLGKRTVSLFGPGNKQKWAPRGQGHIVLGDDPGCGPCCVFGYTPSCREKACMQKITVPQVTAAIEKLEEGSGN